MNTLFLVFCTIYAIITTYNVVKYLKSGTGYDALIAFGYMVSIVWMAVSVLTSGNGKSGLMWYISIYNSLVLVTLILGAVTMKKLSHPAIIAAILLKLAVVAFAISLI